ncbi:MAG: ATP-dependent Clp protease ATP-binding subunit [Bacteroidales bacterium]|nr:ATP-dependent Clp protease ATP-binding subunit [Bacteroidales bacterium]
MSNTLSLNEDSRHLMECATAICRRFRLVCIEPAVLFMAIQQCHGNELSHLLSGLGISPDPFYSRVAQSMNRLERSNTPEGAIKVSPAVLKALQLAPQVGRQLHDATHPHAGLAVALLTIPSPIQQLASQEGFSLDRLRQEETPEPSPSPSRQSPSRTSRRCPTIERHCVDLIEQARQGKIHPAIGRDKEILNVLQILSLMTKNNAVLVGEPGTGKTAVAEGLAFRMLNNQVPEGMEDMRLFQLDSEAIKSEEVMRHIIEEAKSDPKIVLFIDEIHTLIGNCSCANNEVANLLKPEMARGAIKILGATTLDEYTKHIEKDKALERRFQKVLVDEPDIETSIKILAGIKRRFEQHHQVTIPEDVVSSAVKLSHRYITDRRLPDKAIDLMDEAASNARMRHHDSVTENDILTAVTRRTGVPLQNLSSDETERLLHIEEHLHHSIIGQSKAVSAVAAAIRRSRMGLGNPNRPVGSFLFLGTSGVGKTELCKALAEFLFDSRDRIVRIDMSEYQQEHSVARLFGAPPGYVGYDQGGQLTEAVRRKPYSIVLFDEMEKAHPKVYETLLQMLDDGRMTDGQGRTVDFRNTIIVMTSNMGQDIIARNLIGHTDDATVQRTSEAVVGLLKQRVAPEFINRIDNIVMFLPLTQEEVRQIARLQLDGTVSQFQTQGITLTYTPQVVEYIAAHGYVPEYGARPIGRTINKHLVDPLTEAIYASHINRSMPIQADVADGNIFFHNSNNQQA